MERRAMDEAGVCPGNLRLYI